MKSHSPHSSFARWTLLLLTLTVSTATSFAQNVGGFIHGKIQNFQQTSSAAPVVNSAQPFQFGSLITVGTATINSATLTFSGTASPRTYSAVGNGDFSILDTFTTQAQLDSAYQNGNFTVSINTSAGTFSRSVFLFPFSYPTMPMLTVPAGNWDSGNLVIDPTVDYNFTWNTFANANSVDVIELVIRDSGVVLNPFPATQTSYTLPAGSLLPNTTYICDLGFIRVAGAAAGDPDIGPGYVTLVKDTGFTILTTGPTATPTPTPTPTPITISGTVSYCSNPALDPVPGVTVTLTGTSSAVTTTDANGNYTFTGLASGGSYTVTPTKAALVPGTAGINTSDSIAVQRHFLSVGTPLSGCRLTAGDVNIPPNGVNTSDAIAIQRFFLSQVGGLAQTGTYEFNPVNRSYSPLVSDQTGQNFDALILGDVATGFVHRPEGSPQSDGISAGKFPATVATLSLPNVAVDAFVTNFILPVTTTAIDAKNKLVGFQGDFTFDERVVTFEREPVQKAGLTGGNWSVSGNVLPGKGPIRTLRISAFSLDFAPLSGTGTLFELRMTKVSQAAQGTPLLWAAPPNHFIFIDADLNPQQPDNAAPGSVASSGKRN